MGLFTQAAEKTKVRTPTKAKRNTTWVVGDPDGDAVAKAVHELVELNAQAKAIDAKKKMAATVVSNVAKENHVRDFASLGVPPDTPMLVQNADGEKVTFVVQDRSGQYAAKPEQIEVLGQLLGEEAADELTFTETKLGFDRTVLAIPGVSEVVEKALQTAINKLTKAGTLSDDQAGELIVADQKTAFKPGTLERAAQICGRDVSRLAAFLDALGSSCTRYIKT